MEYYSVIKMNELMLFAATWIYLKIIILNKGKYHMTSLIYRI